MSAVEKIDYSASLSIIAQSNSFLAPVADIFLSNKAIISDVDTKVSDNPADTTTRWITWWWLTTVRHDENNIISPHIIVQKNHKTNYTVLLHEYVHAVTHPYILAWDILANNANIDIPDSKIKQDVVSHYTAIKKLYDEAKSKKYTTINGESVEESIAEFCAIITHKKSTEQLKTLWLYDRLIAEIKRHTVTINTLKIPLVTKDWSTIKRKDE